MITKIKKALQYFSVRCYEFKLSMKEFGSGSKLSGDAFEAFYKNGMLVEVHSVEKGLGLKNTKPGHSVKPVTNLINKMFGYINRGYDPEDFAFRETYRVIDAYIEYQKKFDTSKFAGFSDIERKFGVLTQQLSPCLVMDIQKNLNGGSHIVPLKELLRGQEFDLQSFFQSRHSIRMYKNEPVKQVDVEKAVELANLSPSACNRQPSKVYFTSGHEIVDQVDKLITGSSGFKGETPNYIIVTTDRACFMNEEQYQWYINGGIYLSYLTLALHSLGIGSCIMQWKAFYKTENELKKLMGISEHEAIIAVVGCGYYQGDTKCIYAQRMAVSDTLHVVGATDVE